MYDIIIIGAGIVGLTFAAKLADTELCIAIIDNANEPTAQSLTTHDLRVSAITPRSEHILHAIDAWDTIANKRLSPFRRMQVWDSRGTGAIDFSSADIGEPRLGYIIENSIIRDALIARLKKSSNCEFFYGQQLKQLLVDGDHVTVICQDKRQFVGKLCVGADGGKSWVRQQAYIAVECRDYHHSAVVTTVKTEVAHQQVARQIFLEDGMLAFLPLSEPNLNSIVWSTTPDHAKTLSNLDESSFNDKLAVAFAMKLGATQAVDRRLHFPLYMQHAKDYVKSRIVLIGDAAHTIHPLAGQGVNLGIADAHCLADIIDNAIHSNRDIGAVTILQRYQRARVGENLLMINLMAGFKNLFGSDNKAIITLRNCGLTITNKLFPIKYFFMRQAMGL